MSTAQLSDAAKAEIKKVEQEFHDTWTIILDDLSRDPKFADIRSSVDWLREVMERNVPHGKFARAFLNIHLYRQINKNRTAEDDFLNYVSGWAIEMLQTCALIADDIMDDSETRRGMPCWFRNPEVGIHTAMNDAGLLGSVAYYIIFKYFSGKDYFYKLLQLAHENDTNTALGESLDLRMACHDKMNFSRFTEPTYKALVKYKTSYYTFYSPVASAMIRAGVSGPTYFDAIEGITLKTGELFQIQDDFLDCYGAPDVTGKVGTDIKDGKLTWLVAKALQLASVSQIESLREHYGQQTANSEYEVKSIYDDLGIEELFYKHEDATRQEILNKIKKLPNEIPQEPFLNALDMMYRREK